MTKPMLTTEMKTRLSGLLEIPLVLLWQVEYRATSIPPRVSDPTNQQKTQTERLLVFWPVPDGFMPRKKRVEGWEILLSSFLLRRESFPWLALLKRIPASHRAEPRLVTVA